MFKCKVIILAALAAFSLSTYAKDTILLASAARIATTIGDDYVKPISYPGAKFVINVTVVTGGTTVTPKIQGKDKNGTYYDILVGTAISSTGTTVMTVYPGIVPLTNQTASDILPLIYRVYMTHSSTGSYTYSVTQSTVGD